MLAISDGQCQPTFEDMELVENLSWFTESEKSDEDAKEKKVNQFEKRYSDMGGGPYLKPPTEPLSRLSTLHENM